MHMKRHILHSSQASAGYLKAALVKVSFNKVMKRFGTFFLQDLDLEHAHMPMIVEKDDVECLAAMSRNNSLTCIKKERRTTMIETTGVDEPTEQFPIGNAPSWNKIVFTIEQHPTLLISEWIWNDKWGSKSTAARLFVDFTIDYFLTLSSDALTPLGFSKLKDLYLGVWDHVIQMPICSSRWWIVFSRRPYAWTITLICTSYFGCLVSCCI
jgi:hypothetical protein